MTDLDKWAVEFGYSDFDTFLQTGGNILDAAKDIRSRIQTLRSALNALHHIGLAEASKAPIRDTTPDDIEHDEMEPVDSENAHVQGDDHVV